MQVKHRAHVRIGMPPKVRADYSDPAEGARIAFDTSLNHKRMHNGFREARTSSPSTKASRGAAADARGSPHPAVVVLLVALVILAS